MDQPVLPPLCRIIHVIMTAFNDCHIKIVTTYLIFCSDMIVEFHNYLVILKVHSHSLGGYH